MYNLFMVNPSTGVLITKQPLDYESCHVYNLSVTATNMVRKQKYYSYYNNAMNMEFNIYFKNLFRLVQKQYAAYQCMCLIKMTTHQCWSTLVIMV